MKIKIKVKPGSKKQGIEKISDLEYRIFLKERAENNNHHLKHERMYSNYLRKFFLGHIN